MWNKHEHEIPRAQFEQRIEQVRAFVVEQDLSAVLVHSAPKIHQWSQTGHVEYLTNWANLGRIIDTIVVVPRAGTIGASLGTCAGQALRANLEVQDDDLAMIRPGLEIGELVRASEEGAKRKGYDLPGGLIGHGQGLDYSERPFLTAGSKETLKPSHVFVLHVSVGIPGTNILLNPIADLCHVTENGVEVLNHFPRGLFHT